MGRHLHPLEAAVVAVKQAVYYPSVGLRLIPFAPSPAFRHGGVVWYVGRAVGSVAGGARLSELLMLGESALWWGWPPGELC
jgi:hypothetical protein